MDRRRKNEKKKRLRLVSLLVGILIFMIIIAAILVRGDKKTGNIEVDEKNSVYSEEIKDYDIASSYGNLVFPEKWNDYIKTEIIKENGVEIIQFWAEVEDKEIIHVFDIIFGGEGYKIGTIKVEDNKEVDVCIESYSYDLDDTWSEKDKEILTSIDHDINYLLENMNNLKNFTPVE